MQTTHKKNAHYHLPGLFEFYELYKIFLPIYREHSEYFYDWCDIASIYGAPADCLWGGGRTGFGSADANDVLDLMSQHTHDLLSPIALSQIVNTSRRLYYQTQLLKSKMKLFPDVRLSRV